MLQIIFEDKDLLVINKPSGLMVHDDGKEKKGERTLCDYLIQEYPELKGVGEPLVVDKGEKQEPLIIDRPGIVHRLDKDTSGIMLVAKNQKTFDFLKLQFQNKEIHKKYHVFVWGNFKENKGTIDRPIGRSKSDFRKWSAERFARGELRDAVTNYKVIKNFKVKNDSFAFVEALPLTGRTHQIRVHLKAINHPVVSDSLYAGKRRSALGFKRQALHSREIEFTNLEGEILKFTAPYPEDFKEAIEKFVE